jgi:dTDP-4-dehydrorhamnose 3,5-epimerase
MKCDINEPYIFKNIKKFIDHRGQFYENFRLDENNPILNQKFVQENYSVSKLNVIRGLHYQWSLPMGKLVRVSRGKILDVIVDIRKSSPNYGKVYYYELSDKNLEQLWVPVGFAHGFVSLSEESHVQYKCTTFYNKEGESGINPFDNVLNVKWGIPKETAICSEKDLVSEDFFTYSKNSKF